MPSIRPPLAEGVSRDFLLHHRVCPLEYSAGDALVVAMDERGAQVALDDLAVCYGRRILTRVVPSSELDQMIEALTSAAHDGADADVRVDGSVGEDLRDLINEAPVVRFVSLLLREALDIAASDIHIESSEVAASVRYRVDGVLREGPTPSPKIARAVVSRIKLLAELDIAESRRPQDGRLRIRVDASPIDLRVATIPTIAGESVTLRLLDRGVSDEGLIAMGMSPAHEQTFRRFMQRATGLLLVTGPTGSGKTSTLYAGLGMRDRRREKVITVEDPVEYRLDGITQVPIRAQSGVGFAGALRAILRHDPDVILVGELRDSETAEVAVQAALTGHLVLATLHTNDALSAIPRLRDLGIPPFLISATLAAVVAQRLVRKLCDCGQGCSRCGDFGYRGRLGIFELVEITPELRARIDAGDPMDAMRAELLARGWLSLADDARAKVAHALTSPEEADRALRS